MKHPAFVLGTLALSACTSLPAMTARTASPLPVAEPALDTPENWSAAEAIEIQPIENWLDQFEDAEMLKLVEEALTANPSLRGQYFTVEAVRAQARATTARTRPDVSASASTGVNSSFIAALDDRRRENSYSLGLDISWEADLWGRLSARIEAAETDLLASEADLAAARLSVAARTAIAWLDLNQALAQAEVAQKSLEARRKALDLTERRLARGLSTALAVRTARTSLAAAEANIAARELASENAARQLEVLLGRYPAAEIQAQAGIKSLKPLSVAGNPAMLLSRRPDIAAAEARIIAAGLRAEQARLAMLPSLRLSASASDAQSELSDLLDPTRIAARVLAGLTAPVFNAGALEAERQAAQFRARNAVETYASTVLNGWREVEDALSADQSLARQEDAQKRALDEARFAEELATRQYTNGLVSIFDLINSQTSRLNAESNLISARASRASNRVRFHLALGGGLPVDPPAPQIN